ncbi:MAG: glycosyltransferase [Pseudomonadota bacterium]
MPPELQAGARIADITAVISTKDRWQTVADTLSRMAPLPVPIVIIDDGSATGCPFDAHALHPRLQLERRETSAGIVERRNELARLCDTTWLLSLDDDSYVVSGDLAAALDYAASVPDLLALSFPVFNPRLDRFQSLPLGDGPGRVRSFIGCAHLMHRERFLAIGGYEPEIVHQGEEEEVAARALGAGLVIHQFPDLLVHHTETLEYRNWDRMDYFGGRNTLLWADWYVPSRWQVVRHVRRCAATLVHALRTRRLGQIRGHYAALRDTRRLRFKRRRFSPEQYALWRSLPHC